MAQSPATSATGLGDAQSSDGKGVVTGVSEQRRADGTLQQQATLQDGKLHGEFSVFGAEGVTTVQANYRLDDLDGVLTLRDEGGRLQQVANYCGGVQEGLTQIYMEGRLLIEQSYQAGKLQGPCTSYSVAGEISMTQFYVDGLLEGEVVSMHEGRVVRKANFRAGRQEGEVVDYGREGKPLQKALYKDDLLDGPLTRYWPDGTMLETQNYKAGRPVSALRRFDQNGDEILTANAKPGLMQRLEQIVKG
jgi:antitoxin component YwqK of YwqJK toxin-antitoxin module